MKFYDSVFGECNLPLYIVAANGSMKDGVNSMWIDITKIGEEWNRSNKTLTDWADKQPDEKASFVLNYKSDLFVHSFKL